MAAVAKRHNIQNLYMGLFVANTQAVRRIKTGITFFFQCLFLTNNDWKHVKDLPVPSRYFFLNDIAATGVYINSAREICLGWPFMSLFLPSNAIHRDKFSTNREKSAGDNKEGKQEDELSVNRE